VIGEIRLRIPHEPPFHGVALLVVGGLAARLDLSFEQLEDLQLALESVLENADYAREQEVTVELGVHDGSLSIVVGPLNGEALRPELEDDGDDRLSLGRLLGTLVQNVTVEERNGDAWLHLDKRIGVGRPGEAGKNA
jgi:hypothetical protein